MSGEPLDAGRDTAKDLHLWWVEHSSRAHNAVSANQMLLIRGVLDELCTLREAVREWDKADAAYDALSSRRVETGARLAAAEVRLRSLAQEKP